MGYGLTIEDIKVIAFKIADLSGRPHPFKNGRAGRDWYEGFLKRHPQLSLRKPEALSYARAKNANAKVIEDFFAKLAAIYVRLNILTKPMLIFNADETGISKVHKPRMKIIAGRGQKCVWSLTSGERGRTHTVLICGSAAGLVLPPLVIFPRVRMNEGLKVGAPPGTQFATSPKGWINSEIFLNWLDFFISFIPSTRPVLLIYDGHSSHISIEVIEKARSNDIHLLCLPSHGTHVLQPLDVSVMSSFKLHFSKACREYLVNNPGKVITENNISELLGKAWPQALTPNNLISGFVKTGIYPLNPSKISDKELAPSTVFEPSNDDSHNDTQSLVSSQSELNSKSTQDTCTSGHSIDEILKLPKSSVCTPKEQSLTSSAQHLTDTPFLTQLKEKRNKNTKKATKRKTGKAKAKTKATKDKGQKKGQSRKQVKEREETQDSDVDSDDEAQCGICKAPYGFDDELWIQCEHCEEWMHTTCVDIDAKSIPDIFVCMKCL